jgi:hypothetical protein
VVSRYERVREPDRDGENQSGKQQMAEHRINIRPALGSGQPCRSGRARTGILPVDAAGAGLRSGRAQRVRELSSCCVAPSTGGIQL